MQSNSTYTNFFAIRLPDATEIIRGASQRVLTGLADGFFFAPFALDAPIITIPADFTFTDTEAAGWSRRNSEAFAHHTGMGIFASTPRERHLEYVEAIVSHLSEWESTSGEYGKIIATKVACEECRREPMELFRTLAEKFPEACVFIFSTPETGTWLGASPELLLHADARMLSTMSLAGTRLRGTSGDWDAKNLREQEIVTRFILASLQDAGLAPSADPLTTLPAGRVEHLCTRISAPLPSRELHTISESVIRRLSPTPALSGHPRREAMEFIAAHEATPRYCYGGHVGIATPTGVDAYANLRSGLLLPHASRLLLYAGGGIGSASVAADEWTETENKLSTMRSALS